MAASSLWFKCSFGGLKWEREVTIYISVCSYTGTVDSTVLDWGEVTLWNRTDEHCFAAVWTVDGNSSKASVLHTCSI